ncbi:MAG: hypothetical protein QM639_07855 [Rhodocyclaceae bacterium]
MTRSTAHPRRFGPSALLAAALILAAAGAMLASATWLFAPHAILNRYQATPRHCSPPEAAVVALQASGAGGIMHVSPLPDGGAYLVRVDAGDRGLSAAAHCITAQ